MALEAGSHGPAMNTGQTDSPRFRSLQRCGSLPQKTHSARVMEEPAGGPGPIAYATIRLMR